MLGSYSNFSELCRNQAHGATLSQALDIFSCAKNGELQKVTDLQS